MDNTKNDEYYIRHMRQDLEFIVLHMSDVSADVFCQDEVLQDSMMFRMIQISENAKKVSESYKESKSDIPWISIYGLRNRIVHDYGTVDMNIVFCTLKNDIPDLLKKL